MMKQDPQEEENMSSLDTVTNLRNRRKSALRMWTRLVLPLDWQVLLILWIQVGWYKYR